MTEAKTDTSITGVTIERLFTCDNFDQFIEKRSRAMSIISMTKIPSSAKKNADTGLILAEYRYGDRLISLRTPEKTQYYHHDALGSTVNLTDAVGSTEAEYVLDPWGKITAQSGDSLNRQIFTGQEHDENTGLIYFGARYYDPDTARFITQDSYLGEAGVPPSLHRFLYAYSNPTVYVDPDGHFVISGSILTYAALSAAIGWEASVIHEELTESSDFMEAASKPVHVRRGAAAGGIVLSGGTIGLPATALGVGVGTLFDVTAQSAYEGKTLGEIDYEHAFTTGGMFAPVGLLGKGIQSANAAVRLGSYATMGAMSGYGVYAGGGDFAGGIREGNYARAAFGLSQMSLGALGAYGTFRGMSSMAGELRSGNTTRRMYSPDENTIQMSKGPDGVWRYESPKLLTHASSMENPPVPAPWFELWGFKGGGRKAWKNFWNKPGKNPLVAAGHIGGSIDNGKTIWGWVPTAVPNLNDNAVSELVNARVALPGKLNNDTSLFYNAKAGKYNNETSYPLEVITRRIQIPERTKYFIQMAISAEGKDSRHLAYMFPDEKLKSAGRFSPRLL